MIRLLLRVLLFLPAAACTLAGAALVVLAIGLLSKKPAGDPFGYMVIGVVGVLLCGMGLVWIAEMLDTPRTP